jgi:steroid delta-isomerase-like uncharacterized protein
VGVDEHKALFRRWFEEVVTGGRLDVADELLSPDYRLHLPGSTEPVDAGAHKRLVATFRSAFPDWTESVEDAIAEGDKVVLRVTGRGAHQGAFDGVPATGRVVTVTGIGIARVHDGRIAEAWAAYDALGLMQQVGAIPAPP